MTQRSSCRPSTQHGNGGSAGRKKSARRSVAFYRNCDLSGPHLGGRVGSDPKRPAVHPEHEVVLRSLPPEYELAEHAHPGVSISVPGSVAAALPRHPGSAGYPPAESTRGLLVEYELAGGQGTGFVQPTPRPRKRRDPVALRAGDSTTRLALGSPVRE